MNHLESFELFELNRAGRYYQENPDKLLSDEQIEDPDRHTFGIDRPAGYAHRDAYIKKLALQNGLTPATLIAAMNCVELFKVSRADYNVPERYKKVLRQLTVKPNNIPRTLWRGLVLSGYNGDEFNAQWAKGEQPRSNKGRPTSWTTDKAAAIHFMSQERSGDKLRVLLRYDNVNPADIIVDTRELPLKDFKWEKEIILEPHAQDYRVEASFHIMKWFEESAEEFYSWRRKMLGE